ncbi:response regulator [Pseudofulvibacter geojedonensis]|uniref:Response regulator n=1 Tax=Pseudofulvibacter geojedonensis TaxID=1123758 RepID=A0ABW3I4K5_9FLAO
MKTYTVLIIDDHPIIAEAYKFALNKLSLDSKELDFSVEMLTNCDDVLDYIKTQKTADLIFLDMKLPPSLDGKFLSGEDLGIELREKLPEARIIVSTTYNDNYRVNNILKSINPEGFLVKNDITPKDLMAAIKTILDDTPYYSQTVLKLLRTHVNHDFFLDKIDRQLLYELSLGTKMVDLPKILPLSLSGVERRKRQIKEIFDIQKEPDRVLVAMAKEKGFI